MAEAVPLHGHHTIGATGDAESTHDRRVSSCLGVSSDRVQVVSVVHVEVVLDVQDGRNWARMFLAPRLIPTSQPVHERNAREISQDLVVDLMLLIAAVVGVAWWTIRQNDFIKPPKHDQMAAESQQGVIFVFRKIISHQSHPPGVSCFVIIPFASPEDVVQRSAQSVSALFEAPLCCVHVVLLAPPMVGNQERNQLKARSWHVFVRPARPAWQTQGLGIIEPKNSMVVRVVTCIKHQQLFMLTPAALLLLMVVPLAHELFLLRLVLEGLHSPGHEIRARATATVMVLWAVLHIFERRVPPRPYQAV